VGELCGQAVCQKRGYRHVPGEYAVETDRDPPDPLIGRQVADYLVVRLLGVGGFGKVYLALQRPILLKTALKILDVTNLSEKMVGLVLERFEWEAAALALLQHPNVVRLIQYGSFEGAPYLVMEYIANGRTLAREMQERGAAGRGFEAEELRSLFRQLCLGLGAAHSVDIVHRDIKPDNIMLQQAEGHPNLVRILDFGLAKHIGGGGRTITTMGTPEFMAPEQITGENIGPWTDLYAVGVLSFELLSGRRAYSGSSLTEIMSQVCDPSYDPLSQVLRAALPEQLLGVIRRAISRDHRRRFQSARELGAALDASMERLEQVWSPPPLWEVARLGAPPDQKLEATHLQAAPGPREEAPPVAPDDLSASRQDAFERWLKQEGQRLDQMQARLSSERARRGGPSKD
jgi:serine/threonine-protein kinase